jgi:hypothetical protein
VFLQVAAFAMHVEQVLTDWPERKERTRAWFSPDVACKLANNDKLSVLIRTAAQTRAATAHVTMRLAG